MGTTAWWQNARWSVKGERVQEGGSRSQRGRTRASAIHARVFPRRARTQCTYVVATRACARTRALQRRSRARVRAYAACGQCARARGRQRRNSALLWRQYYVIAFMRWKNRASGPLDPVLENIHVKGCLSAIPF